MPFAYYYQRLTPAQQRLDRASDAVTAFLRTLLHQRWHHLDYKLLRFPDSLHTGGFTKRGSSLIGRLAREEPVASRSRRAGPREGPREA
ncbi:MAG: hypothetical protein HYT86_09355 [candidate division NC10 bacterium]|nr:hypothetical protein [candidate division NC10 bacterium]